MLNYRKWSLWLSLALALGSGCAKRAEESWGVGAASSAPRSDAYEYKAMAAPAAPPPAASRKMMKEAARYDEADSSAPMASGGATAEPASATSPAEQRMVHYDGYARIRVGKLEEASDTLVKLVTDAGGRVESLSRTRLVLRVPVAQFRDLFARMLATGDVLDQSISAQDVTEAFQAIELRLQSSKASRERLQVLLARSKDENEKIMLLREIQRLTETIDQLESQARLVADLASMSRVTVDLVPREAGISTGGVQETSAFAWLRRLSPFHDEVLSKGKRLALAVPDGMVALDLKKRFVAESADGSRVRAARLANDPEGTSAFWLDAMQQRLAPEFAQATTRAVGEWQVLRLVDRSDTPYVYVLAVRASDDDLDLVEVYYPNAQQEQRYQAAIEAMLGGGAS